MLQHKKIAKQVTFLFCWLLTASLGQKKYLVAFAYKE